MESLVIGVSPPFARAPTGQNALLRFEAQCLVSLQTDIIEPPTTPGIRSVGTLFLFRIFSRSLMMMSLAALALNADVAFCLLFSLRFGKFGSALIEPEVKLPKRQVMVVTISLTHLTYRQLYCVRLDKVDGAWSCDGT